MNWFRYLNSAALLVGFTSLLLGLLVTIEILSPSSAKPYVMTCFYAIFPLFSTFVLHEILVHEKKEEDKIEPSALELQRYLVEKLETIQNNWFSILAALLLLIGGMFLIQQTEVTKISYSSDEEFKRVHAIGFSAMACIFMTITVFGISSKEKSH
jgi:hypothetical protein